MKTKTLYRFLVLVVISGVLVSCSSSNKVASNFHKRKYTKGIFVDRVAKVNAPKRNTAYIIPRKSVATPVSVPVVASQNNSITVPVSQNVVVEQKQIFTNNVRLTKSAREVSTSTVANRAVSSTPVSSLENIKAASHENSIGNSGMQGYGGGSCKSWVGAVLLCFFLGGLGIHRFYLGYTWQGVVQLLTLGGCGVWALIDFVRIIMKDLKPKDGDYCE